SRGRDLNRPHPVLWRKSMITRDGSEDTTAEFTLAVSENSYLYDSGANMAVDLAACSLLGGVRGGKEKHYLMLWVCAAVLSLYSNLEPGMLASSYDVTGYGLLVADGLGGMAAGEVASRTALTKLVELVVDTPDWIFDLNRPQQIQTVIQRMNDRFLQIDETIR